MKPLSLSMQAFGPFASKEKIDFSVLGDSPLFLINGATGSGKSTILDAICYALYGVTTGDDRFASDMRCDHAEPSLLTEISFDFCIADKCYRVIRSPKQERAKKKSEGTTTHQTTANLWEILDDGELKLLESRKVSDVSNRISTITGLDADQFRQVMVLPQGKFRELLVASSSDRQEIFGQLFQTGIYREIERRLKDQAIEINRARNAYNNQIIGILKGADIEGEKEITDATEIKERITGLTPRLSATEQVKQKAIAAHEAALKTEESEKILLQQFQTLEATEQTLRNLIEQVDDINTRRQRILDNDTAASIRPVFDEQQRLARELEGIAVQINENRKAIEIANEALSIAKQKLNEAESAHKDKETLQKQINRLEGYIPKAKQYARSKAAAVKAAGNHEAGLERKQGLEKELSAARNNRDEITKNIEAANEANGQLIELRVNQKELKDKTDERHLLEKENDALQQLKKVYQQDTHTLSECTVRLDASRREANQKELFWHRGQAALLAKGLQENVPCPVCGSLDHPAPADFDEGQQMVTHDDVERANRRLAEDQEAVTTATIKQQKTRSELNQSEKAIRSIREGLGELADVAFDKLSVSLEAINSEVSRLQQQAGQLDRLKSALTSCGQDINTREKAVVDADKEARDLNTLFVKEKTYFDQLQKDLPSEYRDPDALSNTISGITRNIETLDDALKQAAEEHKSNSDKIIKLKSTAAAFSGQHEEVSTRLNTAQQNWNKTLNESPFDDEQQYKHSFLSDRDKDTLQQAISQYNEDKARASGTIETLKKSLQGKSRPDLTEIKVRCEALKVARGKAETEWNQTNNRLNQLNQAEKELDNINKAMDELNHRYAVYGTLSDAANGKLSLERYVLGVLLDDVLIEASERLHRMSMGRYRLYRKETQSKGSQNWGLDLEVDDVQTGKRRPISTLSGGESFMAALSLALGLSDIVQETAGGIKLDTLFIDEGFGSLDQESLELAINTLEDLRSSGRMIGIISHVTEIKEQMPLRIDVKSSKTGSTIKTVTF